MAGGGAASSAKPNILGGVSAINQNSTVGEAVFFHVNAAVSRAYDIAIDSPSSIQRNFYLARIAENPHSAQLFLQYTPAEILSAYKASPFGYQIETALKSVGEEAVLNQIVSVHADAMAHTPEPKEPATQPAPQVVATVVARKTPPNWVRFEPMDYTEMQASARESEGSGFYPSR